MFINLATFRPNSQHTIFAHNISIKRYCDKKIFLSLPPTQHIHLGIGQPGKVQVLLYLNFQRCQTSFPPSFLSWPGLHVLGEPEGCCEEVILIISSRSHIFIHRHMDDIRVWCDLILTDEGLLSICPSILKVVEETTSVEWMEEVGKAVGLN